jgi:hypothetical protein
MTVNLRSMNFSAAEVPLKLEVIADSPFFDRYRMSFLARLLCIFDRIERANCNDSAEIISVVDNVTRTQLKVIGELWMINIPSWVVAVR